MKKVVFGLMLFALLVMVGCACPRTNDTTGITTKSFPNCIANAVSFGKKMICGAGQPVINAVKLAQPVIRAMTGIDVTFFLNVCQGILDTGCTDQASLDKLVSFLASPTFQNAFNEAMQKEAKLKGLPYKAVPFDTGPLVDWSHTAK